MCISSAFNRSDDIRGQVLPRETQFWELAPSLGEFVEVRSEAASKRSKKFAWRAPGALPPAHFVESNNLRNEPIRLTLVTLRAFNNIRESLGDAKRPCFERAIPAAGGSQSQEIRVAQISTDREPGMVALGLRGRRNPDPDRRHHLSHHLPA